MEIKAVAIFHSPFPEKFGIPRQAGLAESLEGWIELEPEYRQEDALRGLDGFDYIWLIWGFHLNRFPERKLTVRPPRLGGNERVGVFASRSPFRPNGMGLSSVRIEKIEGCRIYVLGADLADGTPIYDIKPYVEYSDSHSGVRSGFIDSNEWKTLEVVIPQETAELSGMDSASLEALKETLAQDPRPRYHDDPSKIYGMTFSKWNISFRAEGRMLRVMEIVKR